MNMHKLHKVNRISQKILYLMMPCIIYIFMSFTVYTQPLAIELELEPDIRTIPLDGNITEILIVTRTNRQSLKFAWTLVGAGRLEGDTTAPGIFYIPPQNIDQPSAKAMITILATDYKGNQVSDRVVFTLIDTSNLEVTQLLAVADKLFETRRLITPTSGNAFDAYKQVLLIDPTNRHARRKIREIAQLYKEWGDNKFMRKNYADAQLYYQRYLLIAQYLENNLREQNLLSETQEVQNRLKAIILNAEPTLSPIVTPSIETARPLKTRDFMEIQKSLSENLEAYQKFKEEEKIGAINQKRAIMVITTIICDFQDIEAILQENYQINPDEAILQRLQRVKQTRKKFEQERIDLSGFSTRF